MFRHQLRLWLTEERVTLVKKLVREKDPTALRLYELVSETADLSPEEAEARFVSNSTNCESLLSMEVSYLSALAVMYQLTGDAGFAEKAAEVLLAEMADSSGCDLSRGALAHISALLFEACFNGWTDNQQNAITEKMLDLIDQLCELNAGNPYQIGNNWWAITHGGALMAAMPLHGHPDCDGNTIDLSAKIAWAKGRVKAFLMHFGNAGIYHEGLGYQTYACSNLLPAVVGLKGFCGEDLTEEFDGLKNMAASMWLTVTARCPLDDNGRGTIFGFALSWNDAGKGWGDGGAPLLMINLADKDQRGALHWVYDNIKGLNGDRTLSSGWQGWFYVLGFYPFDYEAVDPNKILPLHICDHRQGLMMFRDRYCDKDDAVLGVYARSPHVGVHSHDDAGSVRFQALGHDWIMGGGQAPISINCLTAAG